VESEGGRERREEEKERTREAGVGEGGGEGEREKERERERERDATIHVNFVCKIFIRNFRVTIFSYISIACHIFAL
jgi:hypothetical protein